MITKVSEFLKGLIDEERKKLDIFALDHGPTIGEMYEGLTSDILDRAIPPSLNLKIVSGFIHDGMNNQTGQIDCMLVKGEGVQIPYTTYCKWHIKDVIAVFEVKKTLYADDLEDSFEHLKEIKDVYSTYIRNGKENEGIDISSARNTFNQMAGVVAPPYNRVSKMPFGLQLIYHSLVIEQLAPIRIVLGYHGYKSEFALREELINFLYKNLQAKGYGIISFPQLIISGNYSLIKFNGQPYCPKLRNERWDFYGSTNDNPIFLILELIWTKLEREYPVKGFWGEDLEIDSFHPLLSANPITQNGKAGWDYKYNDLTDEELKIDLSKTEWEPIYLDTCQFVVLNQLLEDKKVLITDVAFLNWLENEKQNPKRFISALIETGLVGLDGNTLRLISEQCVCAVLPGGTFVAAENNSGRFYRWLAKKKLTTK